MAEYIERAKATDALIDNTPLIGINLEETVNAVCDIPSADVRPVVRGQWKDAMQSCHDSPHVKCSVCGEYYWQYFKKFNFCPNCGADMREES
jgi:hypothetical protein